MWAILDNPIAVREWRVLWRKGSDWRIWVGVRWPLDPRVWGAPVVLTYALAPYGLWAALAFLRVLHLVPSSGIPVDAFYVLVIVFWCYVIAMSLVLGATAVAPDRERRIRDQLRITALTGREQAAGFFWGRLGPVLASLVVTTTFWCLSQPHYSRLLSAFMSPWVSPWVSWRELAAGSAVTVVICVLSGEIGLLASARASRTPIAIVFAFLWLALDLPLPLAVVWVFADSFVHDWSAAALAIWCFLIFYVCLFMWAGLEAALEQH